MTATDLQLRLRDTYLKNKQSSGNISSVTTYTSIDGPSAEDLDTLRSSIFSLRNQNIDKISKYVAIDEICEIINLYDHEQAIGNVSTLTTDAKDLAGAINELNSEGGSANAGIGSLATLTDVTPLGKSAPTTITAALGTLTTAIGSLPIIDLFRNSLLYLQIMYSSNQVESEMESLSSISVFI